MPQCIPPDKFRDLVDKESYDSLYETDIVETRKINSQESRSMSILNDLKTLGFFMILLGVFLWIPFAVGFRSLFIDTMYWACYIAITVFVLHGFSKRTMV